MKLILDQLFLMKRNTMPSMQPWLEALTAPRSIALVGVSNDPTRVSGRALAYLHRYGYEGQILPVNRRSETVQGHTAYRSLVEVPVEPDLAVISLPGEHVKGALKDCLDRGVKAAIVYASGFAEQGRQGAELQDAIAETLDGTDLRVLGPNCLGVVSLRNRVTATFATAFDDGDLAAGSVALLTQSGAFASFVYGAGRSAGVGFDFLATTGNEVDLTLGELLGGVVELPSVSSVLMHIEGLRDLDAFRAGAATAKRLGKPLAVVKVGTSMAGARAARAHTNADVGDDAAYDDLFDELGIHRVESMAELADAGQVFQAALPARGRATIVSVSGGVGVLMADVASTVGLEVPELPGDVQRRLASTLPDFASTANPVDVTGGVFDDLATFETTLRECMADTSTDLLMIAVGNAAASDQQLTKSIIAAATQATKPVYVAWVGGSGHPARVLNEAGIPTFGDPNRTVKAAALAVRSSLASSTIGTENRERIS